MTPRSNGEISETTPRELRVQFRRELMGYHNRLVRDLAWVILVPPVLRAESRFNPTIPLVAYDSYGCARPVIISDPDRWLDGTDEWTAYRRSEPHLRDLDAEARTDGRLFREFARRLTPYLSGRRGVLYERFVEEWFRIDPEIRIHAANVQIHGSGRTLGQLDFVTEETGEPVTHTEVAVKYYLQTGAIHDLYRWVGTDLHERMDAKIAHMLFHQLPMSRTVEVQSLFSGKDAQPQRSIASVRGILFYALSAIKSGNRVSKQWPGQPAGWWATAKEFLDAEWRGADSWMTASSDVWFSPARSGECEGTVWGTREELVDETRESVAVRPVLVLGFADGTEITRGFLLHRSFDIQPGLDPLIE